MISVIIFSAIACKSPREKVLSEIKKAEEAFSDTAVGIDKAHAMNTVLLYEDFTNKFPDDSLVPGYLYKAAKVYSSIEKYEKSIALYKKFCDKYPDNELTPQCLFLQGFIYDDKLKDVVSSRYIYREFLKLYPQHELAQSVEFLLSNLGKSDEEMIMELEARRAEQDSIQN